MPRFRVLIRGRNFRLNFEGRWQKVGFHTSRYADAADCLLAGQVALEEFRQTKKCQELMAGSLNAMDDPLELLAEDIEEVRMDEDFKSGLPGLAFYIEDEA